MQRRQARGNIGLLFLLAQMYEFGFNKIPPVTSALLGLNIYLFLNPVMPLHHVCISVYEGYYRSDWQRFLFSPFHHADDWHLYFNMVSLLWKGAKLEKRLGSVLFAVIILVFSQLIGVVYILVELMLAQWTNDQSYNMECAVGFSGVLFALKVLNNHYHPGGSSNVLGFEVPNKYSCWAELVAIHIIFSGTSFVGHLSGILVGLLYINGPLKRILSSTASLLTNKHQLRYRRTHFSGAGYARSPEHEQQDYRSSGRNDAYTGGLPEDEQLQQPIPESLNERGPREPFGHDTEQISLEEVRRRRLNRLQKTATSKKSPQEPFGDDTEPISLEEIRRLRLNRLQKTATSKTFK